MCVRERERTSESERERESAREPAGVDLLLVGDGDLVDSHAGRSRNALPRHARSDVAGCHADAKT